MFIYRLSFTITKRANSDEISGSSRKVILHYDWQTLDKGTMTLEEAISRADKRCTLGVSRITRVYEETARHLFPIKETIPPKGTASMQRDIMDGKPSELETQNGALVRLGKEMRGGYTRYIGFPVLIKPF